MVNLDTFITKVLLMTGAKRTVKNVADTSMLYYGLLYSAKKNKDQKS